MYERRDGAVTNGTSEITFGGFRLASDGTRLWRGYDRVPIQPRPLAVLAYLVARADAVVPRDELIRAVWGGTHVTKAVLKVAIRSIREALEDDTHAPRYIETVGRDGYRFIGNREPVSVSARPEPVVGRVDEIAVLDRELATASGGTRRLVFLSGEAGIGKTTVVERFLAERSVRRAAWIARGQCVEHYGEGEPYRPVLEAVGRLARDDRDQVVGSALRLHAPTWVAQLPGLGVSAPPSARGEPTGVPARMLREMSDAIEVCTAHRPLVLVLEDLQWSDPSTVELLTHLARSRAPARLLILGTFRPSDLIARAHPLQGSARTLVAGGQCREIALGLLSASDVEAYVAARCTGMDDVSRGRLAALIYERSEGNALFMVNLMNDLVARGVLTDRDGRWCVDGSLASAASRVPLGLREFIGQRFQSLTPASRRILEAASVAGDEFVVASIAAALSDEQAIVEDVCETLAAQGTIIADAGVAEWPDGAVSGRYRFLHALYRRVLYDGIGSGRCAQWHRAIGLREEAAFGVGRGDHAVALAMHFARGGDPVRAALYHELAAEAALERHAVHEAVTHYAAAITANGHCSGGSARTARALSLTVARARLLMATRGYAAADTEQAFASARRLCDALPESPARATVLRGLVSYHHVRAELAQAGELGEHLLSEAAARPDDGLLGVQAHYAHGATLFHQGHLTLARVHLEAALAGYDEDAHAEHARRYGGYDPGVACSFWLAWTLALMGRLEEAADYAARGRERARHLPDPFSRAWGAYAAGVSQQLVGDWSGSEASSIESIRLADDHGFPHVAGMATVNRGWAMVMQGQATRGIVTLRTGVSLVEATGARLVRPSYLAMLAAADAIEARLDAAVTRFAESLAEIERTGERVHEATVLIGQSHLLARRGDGRSAEACLRRALSVAREQGARLLELRAAIALVKHSRHDGRPAEARAVLAAAHDWFADAAPVVPEIVAARNLLSPR